jgi:3-oxoacyl-[acyl-carrier protein] reductase
MRKVFITGGTGALGQALVKKFVQFGWETAFSFRQNRQAAESLTSECGARAFVADLTEPESVARMAQRLEEEFGVPDALINNAGKSVVLPFALLEPDDWDEAMGVNLKTTFMATHALIRGMIRQKGGAIVNFGSIAGERVLGVPVPYATAKSAIRGFTLSLAREVSRYSIRVNAVVPGLLEAGVSSLVPPAEKEEFLKYCLLGRPGRCEEVADLVEFLASDRASFINAQLIHINGGF